MANNFEQPIGGNDLPFRDSPGWLKSRPDYDEQAKALENMPPPAKATFLRAAAQKKQPPIKRGIKHSVQDQQLSGR